MITLSRPREELVLSYLDFMEEMRRQGEKIWDILPKENETNSQFIERLILAESNPEKGFVEETTFWVCKDNIVVGRIALRHRLNDNLKEFGGHIGYEVHPGYRKKGIAKEMLKQVLLTPKAKEIGRLFLTCAPSNIASNRTILANGGILAKTVFVEKWQRETNCYWIDVK